MGWIHQSKRPVVTRSIWPRHPQNGVYKCLPAFQWNQYSWAGPPDPAAGPPCRRGQAGERKRPDDQHGPPRAGRSLCFFCRWSGGSIFRPDSSLPWCVLCELPPVTDCSSLLMESKSRACNFHELACMTTRIDCLSLHGGM